MSVPRAEMVVLPAKQLDSLLDHVEIQVDVVPGSGLGVGTHWWAATLDVLNVGAVGLGIENALDELTVAVRDEIRSRSAETISGQEVPVLLRLWIADERGQLRNLLDSCIRLADA